MKKVIALSTVLALGALGMACDGGAPANNANSNTKPANTATPAPANTATPATTTSPAAGNTNGGAANANGGKMDPKPANGNTNANHK